MTIKEYYDCKKNPSKYRACPAIADGIRFDSRKECRKYQTLKVLQEKGIISYFLRQVPFDLPGGVKYRVDFMVVWPNGTIEYIDVKGAKKGAAYQMFLTKKKMVQATYPVTIKEC